MTNCPTCGHKVRAPKAPKAPVNITPVDPTTLTDVQLFDYYKRTAPGRDLAFFLDRDLMPDVRAMGVALMAFTRADGSLNGISRPEFYRRYVAMQDAWRRDANTAAPAELAVAA